MEFKQAIYKDREVDLTATVEQLDLHEAVEIPFNQHQRISAIRTAISRLNNRGPLRFKVADAIDHAIITRTI